MKKIKYLTQAKMKEMNKADLKERMRFLKEEERILKNYINNHQRVINKILSDMWTIGQFFELEYVQYYLKLLSKEKHVLEDKLSFLKLERQLLRSHLYLHQYENIEEFGDTLNIYVEYYNEVLEGYPLDEDTICQYEIEDEEFSVELNRISIEFDNTPMKHKKLNNRQEEIPKKAVNNKIWEKYIEGNR